jgi:hypothetical protein
MDKEWTPHPSKDASRRPWAAQPLSYATTSPSGKISFLQMAKVRRADPLPHIVVPDTSVLWHEDKQHPVCPDFDEFWNLHSPHTPLELAIPETVFAELHFQQTTSALKAVDRITESMTQLSSVAAGSYKHRIDPDKVKDQVGVKLSKWVSGKAGHAVKTPLSSIDWGSVADAAAWRKPPFTFDSKRPELEKGFRDCLILETLLQVSRDNESTNKNVIFLCKDSLLREAAASKLKHRPNVLFFESLADFASYLDLSRQELTTEFVRQIQVRARAKFLYIG